MIRRLFPLVALLLAFAAPLDAQRFGIGSSGGGFRVGGMGGSGGLHVRAHFGAQPGRVQPQPGLRIGFFARFGRRGFFGGNGFFLEGRRLIIDPPAGQPGISGKTFVPCPPFQLAANHGQPPALLVFRDGSIYEVQNFLIDAGCVHYRTTYGGTNTVPLAALNLEETRKRNAARSIVFDAPAEEAKPTQ